MARIHAELHQMIRTHDGLNLGTVAVILDSQSLEGAGTVGQDSRGFDGGKLDCNLRQCGGVDAETGSGVCDVARSACAGE